MIIITSAKEDYRSEATGLEREGVEFLGLNKDMKIKAYDVYQFEDVSKDDFETIKEALFDPNKYDFYPSLEDIKTDLSFRFAQVMGQYNEVEYMANELVNKVLGINARISHSRVFAFENITKEEMDKFIGYYINPVENTVLDFFQEPREIKESSTKDLEVIDGFTDMTEEELDEFSKSFSMDLDDMVMVRDYFKEEERNPNTSELQVIDTYWSDHCRHTTFNTQLDEIVIEDGPYKDLFQRALDDYMEKRKFLAREEKPVSLMDMGTIGAKDLRKRGILDNLEVSPEINACALEIKVDVDGEEEDWILYFKNETHNHPTEIEPFGGASTCVGGGIRDPLSGRSWVYQCMRITGAYDPTLPYEKTHEDKLSQRTICKKALEGNSDYANQIGLAGSFAKEIYHPGYEAKRLETGALLAAAPREAVVRLEPKKGDKVILLGGGTGRDGVGAAVGSSQIQTEESLENAGAEVQKGAPAIERKIMRLFRNEKATKLIKRCNDFGAGGVSVAVGELADGLEIDLDKVPLKYPGLHGGEIALAESQERMAVVVDDKDVEEFLAYCVEEDVNSSIIAEVTDTRRMRMHWKGNLIIDLSRDFLDSNGAKKYAKAKISQPKEIFVNDQESMDLDNDSLKAYLSDLARASQRQIGTNFDPTIGRSALLNPYGGKRRRTPELGMVSRLPVRGGKTKTSSGMAYAFDPRLSSQSPFHGGYYAVVESVAKMVAMGFDYKDIRLSFQEFFENLKEDPARWGKPAAALLGSNVAMGALEIGSVGGKDSMSGTYEEIDVPPTLISFAVAKGSTDYLASRAFKEQGSAVALIENPIDKEGLIDLEKARETFDKIHKLIGENKIKAISTVSYDGALLDLFEMSLGNLVGIKLEEGMEDEILHPMMGSFIIEMDEADLKDLGDYKLLGHTIKDKLEIGSEVFDIREFEEAYEEKLASVYTPFENEERQAGEKAGKEIEESLGKKRARALIPVIFGTTGEYDLRDALENKGYEVRTLVISNSSKEKFEESAAELIKALDETELLALPNGSVFGSIPDEGGRAWEIILEREDLREAINAYLEDGKLIFANGTSAHALIRLGLIENGRLGQKGSIRILKNKENRFISDIYKAKVLSGASAFSKGIEGKTYTAPVASHWARIDLGDKIDELMGNGQVVSVFESYFAEENIDGLTSPDGRVFVTLSNFERVDENLLTNIGGVKEASFFDKAFDYICK